MIQKLVKYFMAIILILSTCGLSFSQIEFKHYTKSDGLAHNDVHCIFKDSEGFMWFGTRNGLCKFDGYDMTIYRTSAEKHSISGNRITAINEDNSGRLWIGTYQNGLNKFDKQTGEFTSLDTIAGIGTLINNIKKLKDGTICICSNAGIAFYNSKSDSFRAFNQSDGLNTDLVSDIIQTQDGKYYIATWAEELLLFNRKKNTFSTVKYFDFKQPVVNYNKRLIEDKEGNLWIAALQHGLCKYNPETGESMLFEKKPGKLNSEILSGEMVLDSAGKIWVATDGGGVNIVDPYSNTTEHVIHNKNRPNSLPGNTINSLFTDDEKKIWLGLFENGVAVYDPAVNKFKNNYFPPNIINFFNGKSVLSVFEDSRKNIWIGTDGDGLHKINPDFKLKSYYPTQNDNSSLSGKVITCINEDSKGDIYIGTYAKGLNIYNPETDRFKRFTETPGKPGSIHSVSIWSILIGSNERIWLALLGGGADIFNPETETFKNIGPDSNELINVGHHNVMTIMEDSDGDIWFGTEGLGVYIYDIQAGKMLRLFPEESNNITNKGIIKTLFQDQWGNIWIGTEGSGLFKYNKNSRKLTGYSEEDGLPGLIILGTEEDKTGTLWVSTYDGLAKFNKKQNHFTSYNKFDGLSSNEFNANSFCRLSNGMFIVGSKNGIDVFDPLKVNSENKVSKVIITKLMVQNREIHPGDTVGNKIILNKNIAYTEAIALPYSDRTFSLEFAALNYTHPQKYRYKYKLEGADEDWIEVKYDRRFASYSHLKNGNYVFKVKASNSEGVWNDDITELKIRISAPFWKTFWFIALSIAFILGILYIIFHYRLRAVKNNFLHEQAEKEKRIIELEKENIESELEKMTFYTVNRNRVLIEYKNKLRGLASKAKVSVKTGLEWVMNEIDKEIGDDKEWKYLEPRLDKFYKGFITILREQNPDLTLSEIKVASYVRMNLSSKEIAELMHKTVKAVENDRYRLRKKIGLDSNESLSNYLLNIK